MTERQIVEYLANHFIVKPGANASESQYGHLELWFAAKSVYEKPHVLYNPWMMIGSASGSLSLVPMEEMRQLIGEAREAAGIPDARG